MRQYEGKKWGREKMGKKWGQTTINSRGKQIAQLAPRPDRPLPCRRCAPARQRAVGLGLTLGASNFTRALMERYIWSRLNKQQVGAFAEYFVKMELTMYGFQVYGTEVDDRGIDFVARFERGPFIEIQVKSIRSAGYVFMQKEKFPLRENLFLALAVLSEGQPPDLYLIPAAAWTASNTALVSRDYEGLKSKPEWGINLSKRNMPGLAAYRFGSVVSDLIVQSAHG
jgi:hypothetical protein